MEKGASDDAVLAVVRQEDRVLITYERKDFSDVENHSGILIGAGGMRPHKGSRHCRSHSAGVSGAGGHR